MYYLVYPGRQVLFSHISNEKSGTLSQIETSRTPPTPLQSNKFNFFLRQNSLCLLLPPPHLTLSKYLKIKVFLLRSRMFSCVIITRIFILVSQIYWLIVSMKIYMLIKFVYNSNSHPLFFTQVLFGDNSFRRYSSFPELGIQAF